MQMHTWCDAGRKARGVSSECEPGRPDMMESCIWHFWDANCSCRRRVRGGPVVTEQVEAREIFVPC